MTNYLREEISMHQLSVLDRIVFFICGTRWRFAFALLAVFTIFGLLIAGPVLAQTEVDGPADVANQPIGDVLTGLSLEQLALAFVANIVGYVINYVAPYTSEQVKGTVILLINTAVGTVLMLIGDGTFGFNEQTLVMVITAVISAAIAHGVLKPTGLAYAFGAGRNKQDVPNTQRVLIGR